MCTAITLTSEAGTSYFGRNLDFGFPTDAHLISVAAGSRWSSVANGQTVVSPLAFAGLGQFGTGYPVFLDGVNQAGLAGAALYFPGYASYSEPSETSEKSQVEALDLLRLLLGQCEDLESVREVAEKVQVVGIPNSVTHQTTPMHWIFADRSGSCLVIEIEKDGCHILEDPVGVLTNSPDLEWHLTNLRNYLQATPEQPAPVCWSGLSLSALGQGAGTSRLPGGYTPPERFVRAAFMRANVKVPAEESRAVAACFHALEPVALPLGSASDPHGRDFTQYTAFINTDSCTYYLRTYDNPEVVSASLDELLATNIAPDQTGACDHGSIDRPTSFPHF